MHGRKTWLQTPAISQELCESVEENKSRGMEWEEVRQHVVGSTIARADAGDTQFPPEVWFFLLASLFLAQGLR